MKRETNNMKTRTKKILTAIVLLFLSGFILSGFEGAAGAKLSAQNTWQKVAYDSVTQITVIKPTNDSGFISLCVKPTPGTGWSIIKKNDKDGKQEWSKLFPAGIILNALITARDGGYIIVGDVLSSANGYPAIVMKLTSSGALVWSQKYGENSNAGKSATSFSSVDTTNDGGCVIAGYTNLYGVGGIGGQSNAARYDIYLLKIDASGNPQWAKTHGRARLNDFAKRVKQTKDGGYIIAAEAEFLDPLYGATCLNCNNTSLLLKTDGNGIKQWTKAFAEGDLETRTDSISGLYYLGNGTLVDVIETADNGYLASDIDGNVLKTDGAGMLQWSYEYQFSGLFYSASSYLSQEKDGGYAVATTSTRFYPTVSHPLLLKINNKGIVQWSKSYGSPSGSTLNAFTPAKYGGAYVLAGTPSTPENASYMIKTDTIGNSGGCEIWPQIRSVNKTFCNPDYDIVTGTGFNVDLWVPAFSNYTYIDSSVCTTPPISASFEANRNCLKDSTFFKSGTIGYTFNWDFGDPASGTSNTSNSPIPKHKYPAMGTYSVTLTVGDGKGNFSSLTDTVTILPDKFLTVGADLTICLGASTQLSATLLVELSDRGDFLWWTPKESLSTYLELSTLASPTVTTQYVAEAWNYCYDYDTLVVTVLPHVAGINGNLTVCSGRNTLLTATGTSANSYLWSTGESASSITVSPTDNTVYWVALSNGLCTDTAKTNLVVLANPVIDVGDDLTINYGGNISLFSTGSGDFQWSPSTGLSCTNCPSPLASPETNTLYFIILKDANGCTASDSINVFVDLPCGDVFVPSAFSPDNDENNDILYPRLRCVKDMEFKIFDRWGNKVFETFQVTEGWDGTYKDKPMNPGIYVYYLSATSADGDVISKKGNICLMK